MDSLLRDLKFSARSLLKRPALTIIAIVTLAIGIGANSAIFYVPHARDAWQSMVLVAKTKVEPAAMAVPIRQQVWSIDKDQPVFDVKTMREVRAISLALFNFSSVMLSIFAGVALLLAAIGIYGVMFYAVTQRTQEIGIRMALGARAMDVLKLVVKNGMSLALIWFAGVVRPDAIAESLAFRRECD